MLSYDEVIGMIVRLSREHMRSTVSSETHWKVLDGCLTVITNIDCADMVCPEVTIQ